jgi:biofilm PGA synthesis N-glycosyltransferase PgaC
MSFVIILFWFSLAVLFYCYIGYGLLLYIINTIKHIFSQRKVAPTTNDLPSVTLVIAAYNEKDILDEKIQNSLGIDYPAGKLKIIIITDGSSDGSQRVVEEYPSLLLLHQHERKGKLAAITRAMNFVDTPIVVFTDANSLLNSSCIRMIIPHYNNPLTGGVAGEKKIRDRPGVSAVGEAEGLYWKYESLMKRLDAAFYTVVGAAGELFSLRTELFRKLPDSIILDDFLLSMQVCLQGYKIEYEPGAYAVESPSVSLAEEEKRKVRISAGAYQSVPYLKECLNVFRKPLLSFQYISRRLLRWVICPPLLVTFFITNLVLVSDPSLPSLYTWFFVAQVIFYLFAIPGWWLVRNGRRAGILSIPFYFVFMNYCLVKGFARFITGTQSVLWEKSLRQAAG